MPPLSLRVALSTIVVLSAVDRATAQLVTSHTLCQPTLPTVLPESQWFAEPYGPHPQINGDGAIRCQAGVGRMGLGLYRLEKNERVNGQFAIRFGLFLDGRGGVVVREHEKVDKKVGEYEAGDVLQIAVVGGSVRYMKNGETLFNSPSSPRYPLDLTGCGDGAPDMALSNEWANLPYPNEAPVAVARASRRRIAGKPIRFDGSQSTDPDGRIRAYQWDFGDGHRAKGMTVDHTYANASYFQVKLRVLDERLETAETTLDVNVEFAEERPSAK
jgi:hypothetical protein